MRVPTKHIRPSTVFFVAALAVLGSILLIQERKAARLRAALAYYKSHSHERVVDRLHGRVLLKWADDCPLAEVVEQVKLSTAALAAGRFFRLAFRSRLIPSAWNAPAGR